MNVATAHGTSPRGTSVTARADAVVSVKRPSKPTVLLG
jgi:hypothetical protein